MIWAGGVLWVRVCIWCGWLFRTGLSHVGRGVCCEVGGFVVWGDSVLVCPLLCISHATGRLSGSRVAVVILVLGLCVGTVWQYLPIVLGSRVLVRCIVKSVMRCLP